MEKENGEERPPNAGQLGVIDTAKDVLNEAAAIATYIARHGDVLIPAAAGRGPTSDARRKSYEELLTAISAARDGQKNGSLTSADWAELMKAYAKVTDFTFAERGVNGRTVLDTMGQTIGGRRSILYRIFCSIRNRPLRVGIILFLSALVMELAAAWAGSLSTTEGYSPNKIRFYRSTIVLAPFLIPAAWGGIGSCIFLMKRLTDRLGELAYEESRLKGDGTRIFLGAMLGVIVVVLFFPNFNSNIQVGTVSFGPATAAFIGGLGVKPVYAAFEALAEGLANRVSGKEKSGQ